MKRFSGQISCSFNRPNLKILLRTCTTTALTTQSIIFTQIVHHTRDCVGIIAGVQHIDGSLEVKYWGVWTLVTPAALSPMPPKTCFC